MDEMKFVPKGWGYERWIANSELYCGKLLYFFAGKKLSLHYHKLKTETFYVQSGTVQVWHSNQLDFLLEQYKNGGFSGFGYKHWMCCTELRAGEKFEIPPLMVHQVKAIENAEVFEFSTEHLDSDSYRIVKGD